jgi:prepilin-type N-terminal cleavage/methylation domain-containing protein
MKTNKAFTLVELLISIVIIGLVLAMVAAFVNIFKLLFWALVYFSIPVSISGVFLKLNQKYKWVVKKRYGSKNLFDYKLRNGGTLDVDIVKINMIAFTTIWPIYLPGIVAFVGGKEVYHRYLKNGFSIPEDKQ